MTALVLDVDPGCDDNVVPWTYALADHDGYLFCFRVRTIEGTHIAERNMYDVIDVLFWREECYEFFHTPQTLVVLSNLSDCKG